MSKLLIAIQWLRRSLIIGSASMAVASSALACTCGGPMDGRSSSQMSFEEAGLVARVTMIGTETAQSSYCGTKHWPVDCDPREVGVYSVGEILKGSPTPLVRIRDGGQCTMQHPSLGEPTWIAAFGDAEVGYSFGGCRSFDLPAEGKRDSVVETIAIYRSRLERLNEAIQEYATHPIPLMELAKFLAETHSRLEAIEVLDQVLKVDPLHREAHLLKAEQLARGLHQDAVVDSLALYLAAHPGDREAMHQSVIALVRLGRLSEIPADWQDFRGLNVSTTTSLAGS